jgi:integrase
VIKRRYHHLIGQCLINAAETGRFSSFRLRVPVQTVDATPSGIKLFLKVVFMKPGKRFGLSAEQKLDVWRRWKAGETLHEIGRAFGKEHSSIRCLVSRHGGIAPAWLKTVKPHLAIRTHDIYDVALRCHLKPSIGALLLCDIDAKRVAAYQASRKSESVSARTLNKELQVLRQILKRYKLWANLQGDVRFEREFDTVGKAMSDEEETVLLAACEANLLLRTVVIVSLNTALRKNEIRTLHWSQIDLIARTLTVGRTKTEGGSGRVIPLNSTVYSALVRWAGRFPTAKPEEYIFPACEDARIDCMKPDLSKIDPSQPIKSWRTAWRRALKDASLDIRFHDLRHTCITKLAEGRASEQTLMSIAGHLSRKMVEHYSHIRMAAKRTAVDALVLPIIDGGVAQNEAQPEGAQIVAAPN